VRDTLGNIFSVGKALTAICALRLVERGQIDLGAPVVRLWPEFAAHDKDEISLRDMLTHRAALPALRDPIPDGAMLDWKLMTHALAAEKPWWPPGTAHGYHVNTFGYLVGEVVRRASGKTIASCCAKKWQDHWAQMCISVCRQASIIASRNFCGPSVACRFIPSPQTTSN
jgi:CubicO group peptidase (beta-lactamase class C family)